MYSSRHKSHHLNVQGTYPCPVCRLGQLQALSLMEAMACNQCQHIFTADWDKQHLQMADRQPALNWYWNGKRWKGAHLEGVEWGWIYWLFASGFVVLPTTLIALSVYTFPPEPGSALSWFPVAWIGLTFLSHLAIIGWLVIEFYQFPVGLFLRMGRRQLLGR